jgi:hypothetical protein
MFVELKGGHMEAIEQSADVLEQTIRDFVGAYGRGAGM